MNETTFTPSNMKARVGESRHNSYLAWNVIEEKEFKRKIDSVFSQVSNALTKTLGPYGSTTIIEKYGECHITKDGWSVIKNIRFNDTVSNNIMMLLLRISAQVVIKVGDGSTTSIVAANSILKEMKAHESIINKMRPKEFINTLNNCVNYLVDRIYSSSIEVNKETFEEIFKLAYISTNGDAQISNIIQNIYKTTNNPSIEYVKSKTNDTTYEIIDGYRGNITYIDNIFTTNDDGTCVINNPMVLMFDHKIDIDRALPIISNVAINAAGQGKRLVVIAPHYDKFLLDNIRKNIIVEYKTRGTSTIVYTRASLVNNVSHDLYNDFAIMCGCQVISEQFIDEITDETAMEYVGTVEAMTISEKTTFIRGFINRNENLYAKAVADATNKYNKALDENQKRGIVDIKLNELKQRMTKLYGHMGIIHVGGNSELEKTANFDLVEDAVKACESAFTHGYTIGGSLIIPYIINQMMEEEKNNNTCMEEYEYEMFAIIKKAFLNVFKTILRNKYTEKEMNDDFFTGIIETCMNNNEPICYDLIHDTYSKDIINSCETDIEILKATASIISLLNSSNQYISIMTEQN